MTTQPTASRNRQQRLLDALRDSGDEMSGQQIHRLLENGSNAMGLATVYRNLRQLQQQGLVRCRHLPTGEALYAPIEQDLHHLTCVDCGRTKALDHCPIHGLSISTEETSGFKMLFHTLEFFGICSECQQNHPWQPESTDQLPLQRLAAKARFSAKLPFASLMTSSTQ